MANNELIVPLDGRRIISVKLPSKITKDDAPYLRLAKRYIDIKLAALTMKSDTAAVVAAKTVTDHTEPTLKINYLKNRTAGGVVRVCADACMVSGTDGPAAFAWCHADHEGNRAASDSGIVESISGLASFNNHAAEVYAIVLGLEALPEGASVTVVSDSTHAITALFNIVTNSSAPLRWLKKYFTERIVAALIRCHSVSWHLAVGHPSPEELENGRTEDGRVADADHKWCDAACNIEKLKYQEHRRVPFQMPVKDAPTPLYVPARMVQRPALQRFNKHGAPMH